jgi:hypothetical protein
MPSCRSVFNRVQDCSIWPLAPSVPLRWIRRPNLTKRQEPFRSHPRQQVRLSRPEVPSIDKCSRRSPPPCSRLSHRRTGFQCSFASRMLAHIEARPTTDPQVLHPRASWPHTACQFLQPKRPATTTAETAGPRALRGWCDPSTLRCLGGWQRPLRDEPTETSRARGVPRLCQAHSLRLDRSKRRLSPNPIRSSTFCRKLAWMHGWRCHPPGVSDKQIQCTSSPKSEPR